MADLTDLSEQLLTEIKSTHSNNQGVTFRILRTYVKKAGLNSEIKKDIRNIQKLDGEASQFKADAKDVKRGNTSIEEINHEEDTIITHLAEAGGSLASIYNKIDNYKGEKKRVLKIILLECGFYFWTGYKFIRNGAGILKDITRNESYVNALENPTGDEAISIRWGAEFADKFHIRQDCKRGNGIFNRFQPESFQSLD